MQNKFCLRFLAGRTLRPIFRQGFETKAYFAKSIR